VPIHKSALRSGGRRNEKREKGRTMHGPNGFNRKGVLNKKSAKRQPQKKNGKERREQGTLYRSQGDTLPAFSRENRVGRGGPPQGLIMPPGDRNKKNRKPCRIRKIVFHNKQEKDALLQDKVREWSSLRTGPP